MTLFPLHVGSNPEATLARGFCNRFAVVTLIVSGLFAVLAVFGTVASANA